MKLKILIGILVFLILVNLATIGSYLFFSQKPSMWDRGPFDGRRGARAARMFDREQRKQLGKLMREHRQNSLGQHQQMAAIEQEIYELLKADSVDIEQLKSKISQIHALRAEVSSNAIQVLINSKSFLTPEQQAYFFRAIIHGPRHRGDRGRPGKPRGLRPQNNQEP